MLPFLALQPEDESRAGRSILLHDERHFYGSVRSLHRPTGRLHEQTGLLLETAVAGRAGGGQHDAHRQ